jgi:flagellar basal-body rod modification protein FlgD
MSSFPISATQASATSTAANSNRFSELSSEEFVQIIFTELSNQDPFKPNDSSALLEQLNSIRSIESDTQLTKQLSAIVTQNQLATAGNLIGRQVQGLTPDADRVAGTVVSVARQDDKVSLLLDNGWVVPMENVETIVDPSIFGFGGG